MNIFNSFPHVESCCFCISLKVGSIIIALLHICFVIEAIFGSGLYNNFSHCYGSGVFLKILGYIAIVITLVVLVATIYVLYGIAKGYPDTVVWFMYASALMLIFNIITSVALFLEKPRRHCSPPYYLGAGTLVSSIGMTTNSAANYRLQWQTAATLLIFIKLLWKLCRWPHSLCNPRTATERGLTFMPS